MTKNIDLTKYIDLNNGNYTKEEKERIVRETEEDGREVIYDIYRGSDETIRIIRESERRNEDPIPLPDDEEELRAYFRKVMNIK